MYMLDFTRKNLFGTLIVFDNLFRAFRVFRGSSNFPVLIENTLQILMHPSGGVATRFGNLDDHRQSGKQTPFYR